MKGPTLWGGGPIGFSLLELVVALLLFQVGLLAVAGMILIAQASLRRSDGILRGTLEVVRVGDSLLRLGGAEGGDLVRPWGRIEWSPPSAGSGGLDIWALDPGGADTLAYLRLSQIPPPAMEFPSVEDAVVGRVSLIAAEHRK